MHMIHIIIWFSSILCFTAALFSVDL